MMDATYTPEQLREWAYDRSGIIDADWLSDQLRAHADALEENARLKAELAKLRQHAEAMAEHWEKDDTMNMMQSAVDAYRRDYPEGTK